jgi:autotransporter-associated beta strand protein
MLGAAENLGLNNAVKVADATTLTVKGTHALALNGVISGATGVLQKNGSQPLMLAGANTYGGGTVLNAGVLNLGNNQALDTGALTVGGVASLTATEARVLANTIALNAA